jgi:N-acetylmuramoyl-L-alanine amidase
MLNICKEFTSQNFELRPEGTIISSIVIHFTDMDNFDEAVERLTQPEYKVSSHYIIHKNGTIYELVAPHLKAWHAGISSWDGIESVNDFSIGIELDNNGNEEFSTALMTSLIALCHKLIKEFPIEQQFIVGHSDVAPDRKVDPGYFFDWQLLKKHNIGIYHDIEPSALDSKIVPFNILKIQHFLKILGYKLETSGVLDAQTEFVIRAFNMRFYQQNKDNIINKGFLNRLEKLVTGNK